MHADCGGHADLQSDMATESACESALLRAIIKVHTFARTLSMDAREPPRRDSVCIHTDPIGGCYEPDENPDVDR